MVLLFSEEQETVPLIQVFSNKTFALKHAATVFTVYPQLHKGASVQGHH